MRVMMLCLVLTVTSCASGPTLNDLNCDPAFGACSASIDPIGYDWYVMTDTECALVTMDTGEKLPVTGYKRLLGTGSEYGIQSCQVCVKK
jgi:hypothetical protein